MTFFSLPNVAHHRTQRTNPNPSPTGTIGERQGSDLSQNDGRGGIRTPVGFHPNGFQDHRVMTASLLLRMILPEKHSPEKWQTFVANIRGKHSWQTFVANIGNTQLLVYLRNPVISRLFAYATVRRRAVFQDRRFMTASQTLRIYSIIPNLDLTHNAPERKQILKAQKQSFLASSNLREHHVFRLQSTTLNDSFQYLK